MAEDQLILFKQEGQHVYDYTNVYDPEVDGADPSRSGKIIPALRSIVVDNRTSDWKVLIVESVDPVTYKCTYRDFPYKVIDKRSTIYNHGNDVFMLYFDDRPKPTRLIVDAKLVLFGSNISKYKLLMPDSQGVMRPISVATIQQATGTENVVSTINVVDVTDQYVDSVRRCSECYTTVPLRNGDLVTLELIDANGTVVAEVELVARRSTVLNSIGAQNTIVGFSAVANQTVTTKDNGVYWYVYRGQSVNELSIFPEIKFSDGTSVLTPIDNNVCFAYGLDTVDTDTVGVDHDILIKYFVNNSYTVSDNALNSGGVTVVGGNRRVLTTLHKLRVVDRPVSEISKLSVIPVWNSAGYYNLKFFGYSTKRDTIKDFSDTIMTISNGVPKIRDSVLKSGSFNPTMFRTKQTFSVELTLELPLGGTTTYSQTFSIVLKNPATVPENTGDGREFWYIVDPSNSELIYGRDGIDYSRPAIYYDGAHGNHYISTGEFGTEESFLDAYYRFAGPPTIEGTATLTTPTHFQVRTPGGTTLTGLIPVSSYSSSFVLESAGVLISSGTVIVDFLYCPAGGTPAIIYGVPVTIVRNDRENLENS